MRNPKIIAARRPATIPAPASWTLRTPEAETRAALIAARCRVSMPYAMLLDDMQQASPARRS